MVVGGVYYVVYIYMFLPILIIFIYQLYGWNISLMRTMDGRAMVTVIDFCLSGKTHTSAAVNPDIHGWMNYSIMKQVSISHQ